MTEFPDPHERRTAEERATAIASELPRVVAAALGAPGWRTHLGAVDPAAIRDVAALARLPVLRKADLPALQKAAPPFGGFALHAASGFARLYASPGPILEGEPAGADPWRMARALHAAGLGAGDVVLNTFSYHLSPGGFILDSGARALGCAVIPAGPGNTQSQIELIAAYRPTAYTGTPDFLKILLDAAEEAGADASSLKTAVLSGAAFPPALQAEVKARGIAAFQSYAAADLGLIAYESEAHAGLVVDERLILEIVRPGTSEGLPEGEVGEVVVTLLDERHPLIRFSLGDLSAVLAGPSPCGRTHTRIKGFMGRADQTAKVKGMFVRPEQIAEIARLHQGLGRLRLLVTRANEQDAMTLLAEAATPHAEGLAEALSATLAAVTRLKGDIRLVAPGELANDGKVIEDQR